jgi:hypothetical protein
LFSVLRAIIPCERSQPIASLIAFLAPALPLYPPLTS